jgi:glycosyltransferase involved in cell wall biosynthesis
MDIICYSHLRWNFVFQRPQQIMTRLAKQFRIYFIEEPIFDAAQPYFEFQTAGTNIWVMVPHLPPGNAENSENSMLEELLRNLIVDHRIVNHIGWYYTPMALSFSANIKADVVVYDCMDELSAFDFAPADLKEKEKKLLSIADIIFTGGYSLYQSKKALHHNVHLFPSSIDKKHFERARTFTAVMPDQEPIAHPRIGYFGVIDERMDMALLKAAADKKPEWQFILIGPVVKIDPSALPKNPNVHFLGQKNYNELPDYVSGWYVAMMPFAINEATRFISPTKTPEYLAAGKPVVSTAIADVVRFYGDVGLVYISHNTDDFINGIETSINLDRNSWLKAVDAVLANQSWNLTCEKMVFHINSLLEHKNDSKKKRTKYV